MYYKTLQAQGGHQVVLTEAGIAALAYLGRSKQETYRLFSDKVSAESTVKLLDSQMIKELKGKGI